MRTTVSIRDDLAREARKIAKTGSPSKLVNLALESFIQEARRKELIDWVRHGGMDMNLADLKRMRRHRVPDAR